MKKRLSMLICLAALAGMPVMTPAQELSNPVGSNPSPASVVDRLRGDADDARRRESDLSAQVADQERTNAMLRDQIRRAGNDPTGLGRDLANTSDEASVLRKKVADQRQRRDAAEDKLAAARDRAMDQYEQTGPAKAARDAIEKAGAELDRLSQPIFEQLTQTPAYQEQQALVDAAAQAGEAIGRFPGADPRAQADADAAFDAAMAGLRTMEDAAVSADPTAANARTSLKVAQDTLDGLRHENEKKIAGDPAVDAARFALDLEEKLLSDASAQLATAEKRLSALRQAGGPQGAGDLTAQLRDGEAKLRDLNDRLDQARIARRDTEDRLASVDDGRRPAGSGEVPGPGYDVPPPVYSGADGYDGSYGGSYGYGGGGYYYPPPYSYGYVYPRYGPYYAYDYCPPYFSSGLFLGFGYSSYSHYHSYPHYYPYNHSYSHGYYGSAYNHDHWRDDRWRDDHYRSGGHDNWVHPVPDSRRYTTSGRRYDYARFNATEARRDRDTRSSVNTARAASLDAERDFQYRTGGVRTYDYPGSSRISRDQSRSYEQDLQSRRARVADGVRRDTAAAEPVRITSRSDGVTGSTRVERSDSDSAARRARAADETSRTRSRDSAVDSRGTRVSSDTRSDSSSSSSSSSDVRRGRDSSSAAEAPAARSRASEDASARARASDDSSARRARAADDSASARSRGSADSGSGSSPRGGRSTVERSSPTPPPSIDSGRGSSRGSAPTPPPSFDSGRGSSRGSAPAPAEAPSAARGSRGGGGGDAPPPSSRGGSAAPSGGSSRGGASSGRGR